MTYKRAVRSLFSLSKVLPFLCVWSGGWVSELKKRERSGEVYDENARARKNESVFWNRGDPDEKR